MRRFSGFLGLILVGILTPVLAQEHPDFSGVWTTQPVPRGRTATTADSLGSGWGPSFTIRQDPGELTVEREFFSRGDLQPTLKFHYSLDGSENRNRVLMGRGIQELRSTASWKRDRLVITTTYSFKNPEDGRTLTGQVERTLWLEPARMLAWPSSLVIQTLRKGVLGGPTLTTRTIYTRN